MDNNKFTFNAVDFSKLTDIDNDIDNKNDKLDESSKNILNEIYLEFEDDNNSESEDELNLEEKLFKYVDNNIDNILKNSEFKDNLSPTKNQYTKNLIENDGYDEESAIKISLYILLMMYILLEGDYN
jgi:hypothetical protein